MSALFSPVQWLFDTLFNWFVGSLVGTIVLAAGLAVLAFLFFGRRLVSREGIVGLAGLALIVVGGGALYRWLNAFDGPGFVFYEGNAATQSMLCNLADAPATISLKNHPCPNDEIRSVKLLNVKKGTVLRVFDNEDGKLEDDWAEVVVLRDAAVHVVSSFEATQDDGVVAIHYSRNNGLDGKISRVEVARVDDPRSNPLGSTIAFYEGDNLTQNKVCELRITVPMEINFKNSAECDNDEARSAILRNVPANVRIRLYDDPDGSKKDDWLDISILRPVPELRLATFETDINQPTHRVQFHRNNGLQGKVSRLEIKAGGPEPLAVFYEGNGGTQNIVCTVSLEQNLRRKVSDLGCSNDEVRSVRLYNLQRSKSIRLFDSPDFASSDDWTEILVKRPFTAETVQSFDRLASTANVSVHAHRQNGLDGKVSAVEVADAPHEPVIDLFEGNNGSQNRVCTLPGRQASINFKNSGSACANDEARSLVLHRVPVGTVIRVYDDPDGKRRDDWSEIEVVELQDFITVPTFQRPVDTGPFRLRYFRNNGLDGKVSRLEIGSAARASGILSLYEGANATQNKVCDLDVRPGRTVRLRGSSECENDEARSAVLTNVRAGQKVSVFDNPDCRTGDDWTVIEVLRDAASLTIRSFEETTASEVARVTYNRKNGLNGKVSCLKTED